MIYVVEWQDQVGPPKLRAFPSKSRAVSFIAFMRSMERKFVARVNADGGELPRRCWMGKIPPRLRSYPTPESKSQLILLLNVLGGRHSWTDDEATAATGSDSRATAGTARSAG